MIVPPESVSLIETFFFLFDYETLIKK